MKNTKQTNANQDMGLFGKVVVRAADKLSDIPIDPFQCWNFLWHEPDLPEEILTEMRNKICK